MTKSERRKAFARSRYKKMNMVSRRRILCCHFTVWSIMTAITIFFQCDTVALQQPPPQSSKETPTVRGLAVHQAPLRRQQEEEQQAECSPYCFALSSMLDLPTESNILATQVWPSARVAAMALEERILANGSKFCHLSNAGSKSEEKHRFTICELGCGPGLPSLTAAAVAGASLTETIDFRVIATDVDDFALDLVQAAAKDQGLDQIVSTRILDLIQCGSEDWTKKKNVWMDEVDLFVMSDVFESNAVAVGAARFTQRVLSWGNNDAIEQKDQINRRRKRMWVFAQTDRTQREVFLQELQRLSSEQLEKDSDDSLSTQSLQWKASESYDLKDRLWLCDVDETMVNYG